MTINENLLNILVCPKCKGGLKLKETKDALICYNCYLFYEIKDDIPIMVLEKAKKM